MQLGLRRKLCSGRTENGPDTIFLSDMSRTSSKRFLTANEARIAEFFVVIHQIAKKLPAGRHFIERKIHLLGNTKKQHAIALERGESEETGRVDEPIQRLACGHWAGDSRYTLSKKWDSRFLGIGGDNRDRIGGSHEEVFAENHVSILETLQGGLIRLEQYKKIDIDNIYVHHHRQRRHLNRKGCRASTLVRPNGARTSNSDQDGLWKPEVMRHDFLCISRSGFNLTHPAKSGEGSVWRQQSAEAPSSSTKIRRT